MKIIPLFASSLLFAVCGALHAQQATPETKEPPPDPPLMASAPADCQWTITYTPKTPEKDPVSTEDTYARNMRRYYNPIVLSKRVLKSAGQMVIYTNYEAGIKSEAWVVHGFLYELPIHEGQAIAVDVKKPSDFSEINWVTAGNFRGTVELKGTKVHLYETGNSESRPNDAPATSPAPASSAPAAKVIPRRAYIDAKSRLPVTVDFGDTVMTYQYSGPAASFPTPDERIKKLMQGFTLLKKN